MHACAASRPAGEMEDDDESRMSSISTSLLLYCDEDPFVDDATPPPPAAGVVSPSSGGSEGDEDDHARQVVVDLNLMAEYKARERSYAPARTTGYLQRLLHDDHHQHGGVSSARSRAVHYVVYALGRLGLAAATAFNAVNYLDRFLSAYCHLKWEVWMVELVSVACLSVACKLDEVSIPSLHDLQMEEVVSHSFQASTMRDMELALLKALQWRLACVTPYSYLDLIPLPTTAAPATSHGSRCTRLLLRFLSEPSFLRFDASVVAAAVLRCVGVLQNLTAPPLCQLDDEADECFKMMKALDTSLDDSTMNHRHQHHYKYSTGDQLQRSPISVIPFQITDGDSTVSNRSAISRRLFGTPKAPDR